MVNLRHLAASAIAAIAAPGPAQSAAAQCENLPSEPVILQVPFAPGGGARRVWTQAGPAPPGRDDAS
jgi:tripartite-type tricarboxylate transporter receptor subunit TctC